MEYTLRELRASDVGMVCKIISAIGVKEFKNLNIDVTDTSNTTEVGLAVIFGIGGIVIENLPKAQKDIDEFLSSLTGMTVEDIQNMSFVDYTDLIFEVVGKKEFKDFFERVMKLFNR